MKSKKSGEKFGTVFERRFFVVASGLRRPGLFPVFVGIRHRMKTSSGNPFRNFSSAFGLQGKELRLVREILAGAEYSAASVTQPLLWVLSLGLKGEAESLIESLASDLGVTEPLV